MGSNARARVRGFVKGGLRWEEGAGSVCYGGQSSVQGRTGHRGVGGRSHRRGGAVRRRFRGGGFQLGSSVALPFPAGLMKVRR
jgi:hypothetical protein